MKASDLHRQNIAWFDNVYDLSDKECAELVKLLEKDFELGLPLVSAVIRAEIDLITCNRRF